MGFHNTLEEVSFYDLLWDIVSNIPRRMEKVVL